MINVLLQGWTLALTRSPMQVSKVSGERKSQFTCQFCEHDFPHQETTNKTTRKLNDVFYILFCQ